jgi:hypothetical protein
MTTQRIPKSKLAVWNVQEELSLRKLAETAFESVALEDLTDVDIASPQDGEVLRYDNSLGVWINDTPGAGSIDLDDLSDVTISTPTDGQVLTYDSGTGTWVNEDATGGGGTPAGTTGQVQYNNAGAFAADTGFTYNDSTNVLFTANGFSFVNSGVGDSIFKPTTKSIGSRNGSEITTLYTANGSYSSIHLLARDSSLAESSEIILELRSDSDNNIARIRLDDQEPAPIFSTTLGGAGGTEYYLLHENNVKTVNGEDIYGSGDITPIEAIGVACSDETTDITAGTAKVTFRMPYAFTLTGVRASLSTAQPSGSIFTVDINEAGTSILSTKLTIDNTELTSTTAATAPVISDTSLADDAQITVDVDQIGDTGARGLKVWLIGRRT